MPDDPNAQMQVKPAKVPKELDVNRVSYSAMKGFGVGVVLAVLTQVASGGAVTTTAILTNAFVIIFTLLGFGLGFES